MIKNQIFPPNSTSTLDQYRGFHIKTTHLAAMQALMFDPYIIRHLKPFQILQEWLLNVTIKRKGLVKTIKF